MSHSDAGSADPEAQLSLLNQQLKDDEDFKANYNVIVLNEESSLVSQAIAQAQEKLTATLGRYDFRFWGIMNKWTLESLVELKKDALIQRKHLEEEHKIQQVKDAKQKAREKENRRKSSLSGHI